MHPKFFINCQPVSEKVVGKLHLLPVYGSALRINAVLSSAFSRLGKEFPIFGCFHFLM